MTPREDARLRFADGWLTWRWVCLRSAGFPVGLVDRLAPPGVAATIDRLVDAGQVEEARAAFRAGCDLVRAELVSIAKDPLFREAIAWQNRAVLHTGVDRLIGKPITQRDDKTRQKERLVAKYVQRYATKCESIGFFGPIGWGRIANGDTPFTLTPGPNLVDLRTTSLEYWAVAALADTLAERRELRPWLAPRLLPMTRVEGRTLFTVGVPREISGADARLLVMCNGLRSARAIAAELVADPDSGFAEEQAVFERLDAMVQPGVLSWTIEVPLPGLGDRPEAALRRILEGVDDPRLRAEALRPLDELESAARVVTGAAGDAVAVERSLGELATTFERVARECSTRRAGESYAGRTISYEDCRRDVELVIGRDVLARIAAPLALLMDSARWYCTEILRSYREEVWRLYRRVKSPLGAPLPLEQFGPVLLENIPRLYPKLLNHKVHPPVLGDLPRRLIEKWSKILRLEEGPIQRRSEDLRLAVREAFAVRGATPPSARCHAPDVMLAARDVDAIRRGDLRVVLGEVHVGINTLERPFWLGHHPAPDEILATIARDQPAPRLTAMPPRSHTGRTSMYMTLGPNDFDFMLLDGPASRLPPARRVVASECVFEEHDGELFVVTRDRRARWEIGVFFGSIIADQTYSPFEIVEETPHRSRLMIDDLVVARESWRLEGADLTFATRPTEFERFAAVRRLWRDRGLPRRVFVHSPNEGKPIYVDSDSTALVEVLAKASRGVDHLNVAEMLPGPDETWLVDANGASYVSELRMVIVDDRGDGD